MTDILTEYFLEDLAELIYKATRVKPDVMFGTDINVYILNDIGYVYRIFTTNVHQVELRYKYVNGLFDDEKLIKYQNGTVKNIIPGNGAAVITFQHEMKVTDQGDVYFRGQKIPDVSDIVTAKVVLYAFQYKYKDYPDYTKRSIAMIRKDGRVLTGTIIVPNDDEEEIQFNIKLVPQFSVRSDIRP